MPNRQSGVILVTPRQLFVNGPRFFPIYWGGKTVVVPFPMEIPLAELVHPQHFGVFLAHPRGPRPGGRTQNRGNAVFGKHIHQLIKPLKTVDALFRLKGGPGKHPHRQGIDAGQFGKAHVLFPDGILPRKPLLRVIITPVQNMGEFLYYRRVSHTTLLKIIQNMTQNLCLTAGKVAKPYFSPKIIP
jgi:hypothetical protein